MKKKIVIVSCICACTLAVLSGCSKKEEKKDTGEENPAIEFVEEDNNEVGMGNPWVNISEEEADKICPRLFKAPQGAGAQEWLKCEALGDPDKGLGPMIQLNFDMDNMNFTARAQQGAAEDADISGIYTEWTAGPENVTLANWGGGNMTGQMYRAVGDTGYIDSGGYMFLTGRTKNMFKTSMGKFVNPEVIEERFKESPFILDMMVVGEGQKFAAAIIAPDFDMLKDWCVRHDVVASTREEMLASKTVQERYQKVIDKYNATLGNHEQVKRFRLVPEVWSTENRFLTPTLKIKRNNITAFYKKEIDELFV